MGGVPDGGDRKRGGPDLPWPTPRFGCQRSRRKCSFPEQEDTCVYEEEDTCVYEEEDTCVYEQEDTCVYEDEDTCVYEKDTCVY